MERVHNWLADHRPDGGSASLLHNDYKLDNVMLAADDPGRLVAVFDWDMCTLGDPLSDVGALLTYWSEPGDPEPLRATAMMPTDPRFPTRDELVRRYAERSGRDVSGIAFYHVLGLYRLAVIAAQIYFRFRKGQTRDERFAAFGPTIPVVAAAARARAGL
jgi:aminoglycoside phosphotransferase (APT) family kinase protein